VSVSDHLIAALRTIFEGMKAFRTIDDRIHLFRTERHYERMVRSAERMCMPAPPPDVFHEGLRRLVEVDKEWVPGQAGAALYIRPGRSAGARATPSGR